MPCQAGTSIVFPTKSPPLLSQHPSCLLAFSKLQQAWDVPAPCSPDRPSRSQGTPYTWKGLINSLQRVQWLTNYFCTVAWSAVDEVQVASSQQGNLTLPGSRCLRTLTQSHRSAVMPMGFPSWEGAPRGLFFLTHIYTTWKKWAVPSIWFDSSTNTNLFLLFRQW